MKFWQAFLINDIKNVKRDTLLAFLLLIPWLIVIVIRLFLAGITEWLSINYSFALEPYYPLLLSFAVILQTPLIFGVIFGFLFLDERDDHVLTVLEITPASVKRYVSYRIVITILLSTAYILFILPATGLINLAILPKVVPVALISGFFGVFSMLFLIAFAHNKVEGLALMKAMGILMLGPLAAYFIESPLQILLGILPSYWPAKAYWLINQGANAWAYILGGIVYAVFLMYLLLRVLEHKLRRF